MLLLGTPTTSSAELLADAAARRGLEVRRVSGPEDLSGLTGRATHWYGGPHAASRVADQVAIGLLEPDDAWLPNLARRFTGRRIESATLSDAWALTEPAFVKPPSEKSFPAQVYLDGTHVPRHGTDPLLPETPVLISEVANLAAEYRLFLLDGEVAAASRYAVHGLLDVAPLDGDPREPEIRAFAATLTRHVRHSLPSAVVVDIGLARDPRSDRQRWVVIEANMAWFANCYAADPDRVLDVVLRAAGPLKNVAEPDLEHLRTRRVWA
ncbi:MAG TPA: ATP-grasp domain-containing protein [Actinospica sp.]|nr:ATP-grasp domain-containing protein [Actinospica sp.]